jgi:hypothetical protein
MLEGTRVDLVERGGHEGRRGHLGVGEHLDRGLEQLAYAVGKGAVEHPQHLADPLVDSLGAERGVQVAHVVLVQQGQPGRAGQTGGLEGGHVQPVRADHPDAAQPGHVRPVAAVTLRHHDCHPGPTRRQLGFEHRPGHVVGERVLATDHVVRARITDGPQPPVPLDRPSRPVPPRLRHARIVISTATMGDPVRIIP